MPGSYDAVVVGAGPNGLTAAARLATAGRSVLVLEAAPTIGGGARTAELVAEGFRNDVCSAVHPLAVSSPAFAQLGLDGHGLRWLHPPVALAHPLPGGDAVALHQSLAVTLDGLGPDGPAYDRLVGPHLRAWPRLISDVLGPAFHVPDAPLAFGRFGLASLPPASFTARRFGPRGRALLAGVAAHSLLPLTAPLTTAAILLLAVIGHDAGWPVAAGGSQAISDALAAVIEAHGGQIRTGERVTSLDRLPPAATVLLDVTPRQLLQMSGARLSRWHRRSYARFGYGPGSCKVDYVLSEPIPWAAEACRGAGTVHVGGSFEEIAAAEAETCAGRHPERPYVLVGQPSLCDPSRAPAGSHVAWAYCHTPNGSPVDATGQIEAQIERFAPGWRDVVVGRFARTAAGFEAYNPNNVGGNIAGGDMSLARMLFRPRVSLHPYRTPIPGVYLCSASTPPGGGVHGMCGWHAAASVLRDTDAGKGRFRA